MSSTPRDVLIQIVAKYGEPLLAAPSRCEGLLKDYCGESRREIVVLMSCLRTGVIDQLRNQKGPSIKLVCARLALKLEQNLALSGDVAKWGVESWAIALGLLQPDAASATLNGTVSGTVDAPAPTARVEAAPEPIPESAQEADPLPIEEEETVEFFAEEPEWRWATPDWAHPAKHVTVYPDAGGQHPTLREAVRDACPETCLLLKPGVYRESLAIKKNLQIRAEDGQQRVILESSSSVVVLDSACLFLSGLTLKGIGGKDKKTVPAVEVKSGHLAMEDCHLTSDSSAVMEVKGPKSEVNLRCCHLHDGKAGGIVFQEEGAGYLEECHLYQNKLSHIVIGKGCSPTLFSCKISHGLMAGIYVSEGAEGFIENCDIWGNAVGGVQCRRGANPRLRHCRISMNERYGILVTEQGEGFFEHCRIFDNARTGVSVIQQSNPRFSACQIFDNHAEGVEIAEQGKGEWLDCEIFSNLGVNILAKEKSDPRFYRCVIHDSPREGVQILADSTGFFENCEVRDNAGGDWKVAETARPTRVDC